MSPKQVKMTPSFCDAIAMPSSTRPIGITHTGQPGSVDELDVRREQVVDPVLVDRVRVPAAHLHQLVVPSRLDERQDLGGHRPAELGAGAAAKLDPLVNAVRRDPDVAVVTPPRVNPAGDAAIVTVIPNTGPQSAATDDLVSRLRNQTVPTTLRGSGIQTYVGGATATFDDQSNYISARLPVFFLGIIGLSFLLLVFAFHSPLIALKAGIMNLLSIGAAYGVMTLVAKGGSVGNVIGIDHEVPIAPFLPVIMFAILFGLSMDYEVFLVSRIREEYLNHGDTKEAIAQGLAKTARVITAAAAIMIVVFLAFLTDNQVFLKLVGIGLATAIFVDATIVRMILVPAVMQLLGSRNWWIPRWLEPLLPRLDLEPRAATTESAA